MPVNHHIDAESGYILSTWEGAVTDDECISAIQHYKVDVLGRSECKGFDEVLNFCNVGALRITARGLIQVAKIASESEHPDMQTKLAIIVNSGLAYSFARTYAKYRQIIQSSSKEIRVFRNEDDALEWVTGASLSRV